MNRDKYIEINNYFKELEDMREFSGSILVAKGDNIVIKESYGLADVTLNEKNTIETKFAIASITKSIIAMAIMILAEQKKINIDDTVDIYIPDFIDGEKITIHHLLTHTSGISTIQNDPDYKNFAGQPHSLGELIKRFKNRPLDFQPGKKFEYSNLGYTLLAYIIEMVSGKSYNQYLQEEIFSKLSMTNTGVLRNENYLNKKANGYSRKEKKIIESDNDSLHFSVIAGAGDLYSTVEDIYTWTRVLAKSDLLSKEYNDRLHMDYGHISEEYYYGYGKIIVKKDSNIEYFYQDGGLPGYRSIYLVYPKSEVTVIYLSNYDFINFIEILNKIEEIIFEREGSFSID